MPEQLAFWHLLCGGGSAQPRHRPEVAAPAPSEAPKAKAAKPKPSPKPSKSKVRTCLSCTRPFNSAHPGNRRCPSCRRHDAFADGITEYSIQI